MNRWIKIAAAPVLALSVAACGQAQKVATESPEPAPVAPAAPAAFAQGGGGKARALGDLTSIGSAQTPQRGSVKIDTKVYESSVYASFGCRVQSVWDFDLNREYTTLTATAGVDDYAIAEDEVNVKFFVDGQQRGETTVKLGVAQPVQVDVTNGLRLRVEANRNSAACDPTTGYSTNVALADAKLTK